jgi:hypothetical protein
MQQQFDVASTIGSNSVEQSAQRSVRVSDLCCYLKNGVDKITRERRPAIDKPLFTVSVSDIGLDPQKVEGNLEKVFILAARWEAVLLL